jgi:hypothetical protein
MYEDINAVKEGKYWTKIKPKPKHTEVQYIECDG